MRVLVTGSDGFIGSNLIEQEGHDWVPFDFANGCDVRRLEDVERKAKGCDAIVHLAALSGVRDCEAMPENAWCTNVGGTANMCSRGLPVILASTAGAIDSGGTYGTTKRHAESIAGALGGTVLRFANVYGPGMENKPNLIPNAIRAAQRGESLTIRGDGRQTRDFVHVDDVCRAILAALEQMPGGTWTVGSGQLYSVQEVIDMVCARLGTIRAEVGPMAHGEAVNGDYERRPLPGWHPQIALKDGLETLA